jgi:hypothetical protein
VENGEEVLNPANICSVLNSVLSKINNEFAYWYLDEVVRLLNVHPIPQSTADHVRGHINSISGPSGTKSLAVQVWAIWFIVTRSVWDGDNSGVLVADEISRGRLSPRLQRQ